RSRRRRRQQQQQQQRRGHRPARPPPQSRRGDTLPMGRQVKGCCRRPLPGPPRAS
ncbi:unnamed protein product, partial [Coccothraustes coccothraustes]